MSEKENENLNEEASSTEQNPDESIYISKEATHNVEKAPKKRWYVVHTYSGYENKVKVNLEKRVEYMNMGEKIFRIEVPQKTITQVRSGKKTKKEEKHVWQRLKAYLLYCSNFHFLFSLFDYPLFQCIYLTIR